MDQDDFREGYPKAGDIGARSFLRKVVVTLGVSCYFEYFCSAG